MWKDPDPDPGGQVSEPQSSREIKDLQDQNEQQQVLIAQLKEMLRKEQSTVPQEKVEEYINTLSKVKAKKSRLKRDDSGNVDKGSGSNSSMDSKKHERVNLLKQQMEENKARLAERGMRQKDIEEMVTAIKTQLNDSQQIINISSIEKNLDYNKHTSPEELYNILLVKEKKITDLLEKTKKQEGVILDLQENLKEKDQIIDARTKAITLMTDNLSKKGKDTLDALDETKEQMRKMQENFITLETEMKARQLVLLNDLKAKNVEISELQKQNEKLIEDKNEILKNSNSAEKSDINNHEVLIKDLQQKLADSKTLVDEYALKIKELELKSYEETDSQAQNVLEKLKKQLDESNKNMIKVKAQNKSKIKELNKKLDAFKKMSDANAMIVQLQNEITKLNEKIAELEDEKGNVQLKMVESIDSLKGSFYAEEVQELKDRLDRNAEEFDEKEKVIHLLENEIISLKKEITNLTEKNDNLSLMQNEQVTSEIKSIQIEEQLEDSQKENHKLKQEIEELREENNELFAKIEEIKKEKLDLVTKLDSYIQENMELIDKLEKLSAEKVSSAESIEIVEGLTPQEKLELAAYQKNLEEPTKTVEEEAPSELNETVSQLTEDSTELLNRIEMFNVERKEVMLKLDALKEENNRLSLKLNEVENYRDILVETYEQVQTEKDDLQKENKQIVQKLKQLEDDMEPKSLQNETMLKFQNQTLRQELLYKEEIIKNLHQQLEEKDSKIHETIDEMKLKYLELQQKLDNNSGSLETQIEDLSKKNKEQLEKMKKIAANLKKKTQAYQELEKRYIGEKEKWETEINMKESNNSEIEVLKQELKSKIHLIDTLQQQNVELQNMLIEARQKQDKVTEVSLKQELSTSLHEEFDTLHGNNQSTNEDKINELQLIIETNEMELNSYKERNQKLKQDLSVLLEEKDSLINRSKQFEEQLNLMEKNLEEKIMLEKEMSKKFEGITANNETLTRTLEDLKEENRDLTTKNKEHEELIMKLKIKLKKSQEKVSQLKTLQSNLEEQEQLYADLQKQFTHLEFNHKQIQFEYEELQKQNQRDYEKIEVDYQGQLEGLVTSRNELTFECEKLEETIKVLKEREEELTLENNDYKQKLNECCDQITKLTENLNYTSTNWQDSITKIETLQLELDSLQKLRITHTATDTVEGILSEAKEKIVTLNTKETQTDSDVLQTIDHPIIATKEDLENKIKALEVLLYNVDKEKEQVVSECAGMLNELTKLVYEKIKNNYLDTQILSSEDINASVVDSRAPATSACSVHPPILEIESLIMSPKEIDDLNDSNKLQQIEFATCDELFGHQSFPVQEKLVKPSKAYLTYQVGEAIGENDDGWGWGPEEARLEEEHQLKTENTPQMQVLRSDLNELTLKVHSLQAEKDTHLKEIEQLQLKMGKLIKKCKELKIKNEELLKKTEKSDFYDLEQTIQDELKTQIEQLEQRINEYNQLLDKEKQEKAKLLSRVDVLTAANEKMTEIKEIQDCEILKWKRKYEETLNSLQWEENESALKKENPSEDDKTNIDELKTLIKDLTADNEELQALLDDQKQQRMQLERSKSVGNETRMQHLEEELNNKETQIKNIMEEKERLEEQLNRLQNEELPTKTKLILDLKESVKQNEELNTTLLEKCKQLENSVQLEELKVLLTEKSTLADQFKYSNDSLNQQICMLSDELERLKNEFNNLEANSALVITNLQGQLEIQQNIPELTKNKASTLKELIDLFISNQEELEELRLNNNEITETNNFNSETIKELEEKIVEINQLYIDSSKTVVNLQTELDEYKQKLDQLQIEHVSKLKDLEEFRQRCSELESNENIKQSNAYLESVLKVKDEKLFELTKSFENILEEKGVLEEEIKTLKDMLNTKQVELDKVVIEMENKMVDTISDLEEKWSKQVDERGNTVAESWKYHLSIVESDFAVLQEKLKNEINELEEKCNGLVNENNELRKNVDVEIKNEVDRISALQQQINDRQRSLNELSQLLANEQLEKSILAKQVSDMENIKQLLMDKEVELASLKTLADTTRQQFDEKREVVEEIVKILEKNTSFPLSCEKQDILTEIQKQLNVSSENEQEAKAQIDYLNILVQEKELEILKLKEESAQLQFYCNTIQEKDEQISKLNEFIGSLQIQVDQILEKDQEILDLRQNIDRLKEQLLHMEEKEIEIVRLQGVVEEYKVQQEVNQHELLNLQKRCSEANCALENYKLKLEELHQNHIFLQKSIDEKNSQISFLNQQLQQTTDNKETHRLETELSNYKQKNVTLEQSLTECQQQLFNITQDLATKCHECETLNQQLAYSQQNDALLQEEINRLNENLHSKEQEYAVAVENVGKSHYKELESHYEEIISAKDLDNETLRMQVAESLYNNNEQLRVKSELEQRVKELEEKVSQHFELKKELEIRIHQLEERLSEQSSLADEENKQLSEMRSIIEEQIVKIEDLKKKLFEKSKDYDSLIAEMDISRNAITQQPVPSGIRVVPQSEPQIPKPSDDDLSASVNRAELDIALYMLHQRDVRCEELTVELTHLLEERDTLQLRLSNSLREKEELRRKYSGLISETSISASGDPEGTKTSETFLPSTSTDLTSELQEQIPAEKDLASKLSELKQIGYKKDKTFVDEQELRRLQQMSIMQDHIREAAKLPPEAAAKLVDASYTLSRDIQSPSKVLLNWLWGRSTPKINDT